MQKKTVSGIFANSAYAAEAIQDVLPLVYKELKRLAAHFLKSERKDHSMMATELVHETYVRLIGIESITLKNRRHFFAMAAMAMRRILIDHERRRRSGKRINSEDQVPLEPTMADETGVSFRVDLIALDDALKQLEDQHPRQAKAIELNFFAGLTEHQIADVLEVSRPTVARDLKSAKRFLKVEMNAQS